MTDSKEAKLYAHLIAGKKITHWQAFSLWRMCDFRKALTRMRKYFRREGWSIKSQWRFRVDGKRIVRFREHWLVRT